MEQNWMEEKLNSVSESIDSLFSGDFNFDKLTRLIRSLIQIAEKVFEDGTGEEKLELFKDMFEYFDEKYDLINKIDDIVDFKKIVGPMLGAVFEVWDRRIIKYLIYRLVVPIMVRQLWPKN